MTHASTLFATSGDDMMVGGISVRLLAERVGSTPFYAYDRAAIANRIAELRANLPGDLRVHYAMKANPMPAVVQHLAGLVDGIDVASAGEMLVALDAAAPHISFAGPGKTDQEIRRAVAAGVVLNVESERELRIAAAAGDSLGVTPRVALRVNPKFELKSAGMKMGGAAQQFGIDSERAPEVLAEIKSLGVSFEGFHVFSGSQNLRADAIIEAQASSIALIVELATAASIPVNVANIGGGLGIPYAPGDTRLDFPRVCEALDASMDVIRKALPATQVALEMGRYIVGEAGIYVCRVVDRKISRGKVFLVTDGGLHHHLAATGNFGQVIRRNYPVVAPSHMADVDLESANVVGPLCTPLDLLASSIELPVLEPGDLVAVLQSGAYGLTASPTAFLSHPPAKEILV